MSQEEINQFYEAALEANTNLIIGLIKIIFEEESRSQNEDATLVPTLVPLYETLRER